MPSYCPFALKIRFLALLTAGKRKGTGVYEDIFVLWTFTTFCAIFFFLYFFFTHDIHPRPRQSLTTYTFYTPTTHDPLPTPTTSTNYPRWTFHMWRYHVFARKFTWCFIPVYITIIHGSESTTSHLNNNNNNNNIIIIIIIFIEI